MLKKLHISKNYTDILHDNKTIILNSSCLNYLYKLEILEDFCKNIFKNVIITKVTKRKLCFKLPEYIAVLNGRYNGDWFLSDKNIYASKEDISIARLGNYTSNVFIVFSNSGFLNKKYKDFFNVFNNGQFKNIISNNYDIEAVFSKNAVEKLYGCGKLEYICNQFKKVYISNSCFINLTFELPDYFKSDINPSGSIVKLVESHNLKDDYESSAFALYLMICILNKEKKIYNVIITDYKKSINMFNRFLKGKGCLNLNDIENFFGIDIN